MNRRLYPRVLGVAAVLIGSLCSGPGRAEDESRRAEPAAASAPGAASAPAVAAPSSGDWHLVPAVLPAYQPETSFLIGGAAVLALEPPPGSGRRESVVTLAAAASVRRQYSVLLSPDLYLDDDRLHLGGTLSVSRFPDLFFGIGNDTRLEDEESFTPLYYDLELSPKLRLIGAYLGPSLRVFHVDIVQTESDGALASADVVGSRGGTSVELGVAVLWDTRDSTLYPRAGGVLRARAASARGGWGSDFDYDVLRLDARRYLGLPWPLHVLGLQALAELRRGEPPFYGTGRLGGAEVLRGYYEGRYRDRQYLAAQAEYRLPLVWRLGAVFFASAGDVARALDGLRLADVKLSGGAGLRLAPLADVPVNIRLDVAYGDAARFYFSIGEAF